MGNSSADTSSSAIPPEDRLNSWKEIATYLNRDVTTVQRWEKREGMPVRRHLHDRLGSVHASRAELDAWALGRNLPPTAPDSGTRSEANHERPPESAKDAGTTFDSLGEQPAESLSADHRVISGRRRLFAAVATVIALATAFAWKTIKRASAEPSVVRLTLSISSDAPPDGRTDSDSFRINGAPVISPDGRTVVLSLASNGIAGLWMRRLDSEHLERLDGGEGGEQPFWSPDGSRIGFFADGKLKKMQVPHGTPEVLCQVQTVAARRAAWSSKGTIIFGVNYRGLMAVPENGGDAVLIAGLDKRLGENSLRDPQFLPDGNHFVYFSRTLDPRNHAVYLDALDTVGKVARKKLVSSAGSAAFGHDSLSGNDFLIFADDGRLWARHFDHASGSLTGERFAIGGDADQFSVSATGVLVYRSTGSQQSGIVWINRRGELLRPVGVPGDYLDVSLSPDERSAAVLNHRSDDGRFRIDVIDLARNVQTPFTNSVGRASGLVWSRDSRSLYFTAWSDKQSQVLVRKVDSAAAPELVIASPERYDIRSVTRDERTFVAEHWVTTVHQGLAFGGPGQLSWQPFQLPPAAIERGQFSPDGKWLLYQSSESGRFEIYVSDFPGLNVRRRVSALGGTEPRWSRDGKEIFYVAPGGILTAATIEEPVHMTFGEPQPLLRLPGRTLPWGGFSYDVSRDRGRFIVLNQASTTTARNLSIILNWPKLTYKDSKL